MRRSSWIRFAALTSIPSRCPRCSAARGCRAARPRGPSPAGTDSSLKATRRPLGTCSIAASSSVRGPGPLEVLDRAHPLRRPSARLRISSPRSAHPCSCARAGGRGRSTSDRGVGPSHTTRAVVRPGSGPSRGEVRGERSRRQRQPAHPFHLLQTRSPRRSRNRVSGVSRGTASETRGGMDARAAAAGCTTSACRMGRRSAAASSASRSYNAPPTPRRRDAGTHLDAQPGFRATLTADESVLDRRLVGAAADDRPTGAGQQDPRGQYGSSHIGSNSAGEYARSFVPSVCAATSLRSRAMAMKSAASERSTEAVLRPAFGRFLAGDDADATACLARPRTRRVTSR